MALRVMSRRAREVCSHVLLALIASSLAACGGGGGGVDLASGQGPDPVVLDVPTTSQETPRENLLALARTQLVKASDF